MAVMTWDARRNRQCMRQRVQARDANTSRTGFLRTMLPVHVEPNARDIESAWGAMEKRLLVAQVVCTRGICTPLRLAIPPLKAPLSFACSVASLSRSPGHYQPGHHSFRRVAPAECHLGWDKPSTCSAARSTVPNTAAATPHTGDREP